MMLHIAHNTVGCRYNVVQHDTILPIPLQWLRQIINRSFSPQTTPHNSPYRVSHVVSFMGISDKINHVITSSHCTQVTYNVMVTSLLRQNGVWTPWRKNHLSLRYKWATHNITWNIAFVQHSSILHNAQNYPYTKLCRIVKGQYEQKGKNCQSENKLLNLKPTFL